MSAADPRATARFLAAFFDELCRWGVREAVVSPGSRSTPLAMCAYELSRRAPERLRLFVDVDERGAAFFALGMAKASGRPAAIICTSGTAVANYYPAVLEAESSRVPLIVLTGDRPPLLQGLGAPQTCDQLKAYGDHVRSFRQMPLPADDASALAFARQAAREACIFAGGEGGSDACAPSGCARGDAPARSARIAGYCWGGPVHLNFPFDEPLKPDLSLEGLFGESEASCAADLAAGLPPMPDAAILHGPSSFSNGAQRRVSPRSTLDAGDARMLADALSKGRMLVMAGEGTCATAEEAREVLSWARAFDAPLLADPLSGLRTIDDPLVIDGCDGVLGTLAAGGSPGGATASEDLSPQVIVRFGRYPVSKRATRFAAAARAAQIVVDERETRDFNASTDCFVSCRPVDFARSLLALRAEGGACAEAGCRAVPSADQRAFAKRWIAQNEAARLRAAAAGLPQQPTEGPSGGASPNAVGFGGADAFEGAYVRRLAELIPEGSCLFAANSMSIRALDTFLPRGEKKLSVLCNRGLNGIDGTVSAALGAAQMFSQTTLLTGDLTLLHDLNALALQRELRVQRAAAGGSGPGVVIVLLNNNGGGIFDMLPQKSEDPYFERLFLTPQDVDFEAAAHAFGVPYRVADSVADFDGAYRAALGVPGISLIEVRVPLAGLKERYAPYWEGRAASFMGSRDLSPASSRAASSAASHAAAPSHPSASVADSPR